MANDQISLDEYLKQLNTSVEDFKINDFGQMGLTPIEPLNYSSGDNGSKWTADTGTSFASGVTYSHPSYGAVPNVTISSGINVSSPVWTTTTNNTGAYTFANQNIQPNNTVHIKGKDADLLINDKSLKTWMEKVEERLNILTPNPEMEAEWDQLRKLGERYRKLEKKCKEKSDMWNKLKAMPKPEIK
jgi:hypothetical protein